MDRNIASLIETQKLDADISRKSALLAKIPMEVANLQGNLDTAKKNLADFILKQTEEISLQRSLELDVESLKAKIAADKKKLLQIKTNVEYRAILRELEGYEKQIAKLEDEQLQLMEATELRSGGNKELESLVKVEEEKFNKLKKEKELLSKELESELEILKNRRSEIVQAIDNEIFKHYEKISSARNGVGIAMVVKRECQACFQIITQQMFYDVMSATEPYRCPHCNRYIYYNEEAKEEVADK
ncbi:MAG: zinc ribbon domain-containing protein [Nitrospinota bacterium]